MNEKTMIHQTKLAKPFLLITGTLEAGTSFLARALNSSGVYLGNFEELDLDLDYTDHFKFNRESDYGLKSHWGNKKLLELAEETLVSNYGTWDQPPQQQKLIVNEELGRRIRNQIQKLLSHPSLAAGFKDSQLLLYLDSWLEYLPRDPVIVGLFRHPIKVAESLKRRYQFSHDKSLNLWKIYNYNLISFLEKYDGFLLDFDWQKERLLSEIKLIANKLGLVENIVDDSCYAETVSDVAADVDILLAHPLTKIDSLIAERDIMSLYSKLQKRSQNNCEVRSRKYTPTQEEQWEIMQGLLLDIQNQRKYFNKISSPGREKRDYIWSQFKIMAQEHQKTIEEKDKAIDSKDNQILQLKESIKTIDSDLKDAVKNVELLQNINLEHQKTIEEKDKAIDSKDNQIKTIDGDLKDALKNVELLQINQFDQTIKEKEAQNTNLNKEIQRLHREIDAIHNSISWRTLTPIKKRYDRLLHKVNKKQLQEQSRSSQSKISASNVVAPTTVEDKHVKVSPKLKEKKDIVCFPATDWGFRYQREQHLLSQFANRDHRIFYLTVSLYPSEKPYDLTNITDNIFEVNLNCSNKFNIYKNILDYSITESLLSSISAMSKELDIDGLSFVVFPTWAKLVFTLNEKYGWPIIYDCIDDHYGFGNVHKERENEEIKLFQKSDIVITTSAYLYKKARMINGKTLCIPNAGEYDHFKNPPQNSLLKHIKKPIVGYYGAIAEWFDNDIIEYVASKRPDVNFVFIGHTFGSDISKLQKLTNVYFLGEKPYRDLPLYLYHFDVCLIPFKMTSLIEATHPVKIYEYFAAGKPVVSTKITELLPFGNLCYLSSDKDKFLTNIDRALNENDPDIVRRRIEFASKNTWQHRFDFLYSELDKILVK
jgi:glycosyltransferase involved in cell wall biosynthesis